MALPLAWNSAQGFLDAVEQALRVSITQDGPTGERLRTTCKLWRLGAEWNARDAEECRTIYKEIRQTGERITLLSLVDWSYFHFHGSHYREALRCATESFAVLMEESKENPYLAGTYTMYQHVIVRIYLFLGEWNDALREADAMVATVAKNGNSELAEIMRSNRALIHLHGMDFDSVSKICEPILKMTTFRIMHRYCRLLAGCADAGRGDHQRALEPLLAVRHDMEQQPLMDDWHSRVWLQSGFTDANLAKGDLVQARLEAEVFLKLALAAEEHTWRALAFEANARVAIAEGDLSKALDCVTQALRQMEGFELPLAAWQVHGTASVLHERMRELLPEGTGNSAAPPS